MRQDEEIEPFGRLVAYQVKGLLGTETHSFFLEPEVPTILTGANGTGKSTILRTIASVGEGAWWTLAWLPFKSLTLEFEKAAPLRIRRFRERLDIRQGDERFSIDLVDVSDIPADVVEEVEELIATDPAWERRSYATWAHDEYAGEARERMRFYSRRWIDYRQRHQPVPHWLQLIPSQFPVRFITDQRLVVRGRRARVPPGTRSQAPERVREAASQYARDLAALMSLELSRYAAVSQREDRAFPRLVVEAMAGRQRTTEAEVRALLASVAARRQALEEVGLAETQTGPQFDPTSLKQSAVRPVINTYAELTLRKFAILENLRVKLELLTDFLNRRFVGKRAITDAQEGLTFLLEDGSTLGPGSLSSGEQQMLVLAYGLLFETIEGTLLLIDEPELSLHVGWQRTFVDDITEMGKPRAINFLLATHSPTLVGGREDLKRSLDEPTPAVKRKPAAKKQQVKTKKRQGSASSRK